MIALSGKRYVTCGDVICRMLRRKNMKKAPSVSELFSYCKAGFRRISASSTIGGFHLTVADFIACSPRWEHAESEFLAMLHKGTDENLSNMSIELICKSLYNIGTKFLKRRKI